MASISRRPLVARLIMAVAAVGLFVIGYQWGNQYQRAEDGPLVIGGVLVRPPQPLPELTLEGALGREVASKDLDERWTLIALGGLEGARGHRAVQRLIQVYNRIADDPDLQADLQLWLVGGPISSLAAARDFERLSPHLGVLSADETSGARLRAALGAGVDETADTAATLYLIGPKGRLLALFPGSQPEQEVAEDLKRIAANPERLDNTWEAVRE